MAEENKSNIEPKRKNRTHFWTSDRAILMICMGIAFLLWLFTKLSYTSKSVVSVELNYQLNAQDLILSTTPPSKVDIEVEGMGWDLLRLYFSKRKYEIDISLDSEEPQVLDPLLLRNKIARQLPEDIRIVDFRMGSIQLIPEKRMTKEVLVVLGQTLNINPLYQIKDSLRILPPKVRVSGPASVLNELETWPLDIIELQDIKNNFQIKASLRPDAGHRLQFMPTELRVEAEIEQVTEKTLELSLSIQNLPQDIAVVLLPAKVKVSCIVGLSHYEELSDEQITAIVDFGKIDLYAQNEIKVEIEGMPHFVQKMQFQPKKVEYIIRTLLTSDSTLTK